jgi:hypothetical protein
MGGEWSVLVFFHSNFACFLFFTGGNLGETKVPEVYDYLDDEILKNIDHVNVEAMEQVTEETEEVSATLEMDTELVEAMRILGENDLNGSYPLIVLLRPAF